MFRTLIHPSSGICDFSIVSPHWFVFLFRCVLEFRCGWVGVVSVFQASTCHTDTTPTTHTETPTHIETRTHNQCGDTIENSEAPDDGCINVRNMLSREEVEWSLINFDIKLVSYSSIVPFGLRPVGQSNGLQISSTVCVFVYCDRSFVSLCRFAWWHKVTLLVSYTDYAPSSIYIHMYIFSFIYQYIRCPRGFDYLLP